MRHHTVTVGTFLLLVGCGGEPAAPLPPISVTFSNFLYVPVNMTVGGVNYGQVLNTKTVVFPGGTTTVRWTAEDMEYIGGAPIEDDLTSADILVANLANLEITNVVGSTVYFTPFITNSAGQAVAVALTSGSSMRCIGTIDAGATAQGGYYLFAATTQVRIYRAGTGCTGQYYYWDYASMQGYVFSKTGLVLLEADHVP